MPCYHPRTVWRSKLGPNPGGAWPIVFDIKLGIVNSEFKVPCGQCIGCRLERSRQWAIRCVHESKMHVNNSFITLTYNDENLKKRCGVYDEEQNKISALSLNKRDFVLFMKRLRRQYEPKKIRFFHCGEYGEKFGRPHHHVALFGHDFQDKVPWSCREGIRLYVSDELNKIWGHGLCVIGDVTFESAAYIARYVTKKITGKAASEHYDGIQSEYCTMSRKPGLGKEFLKKYVGDVYNSDVVIMRGKELKPPRYYDKIYESMNPTRMALLKQRRKEEQKLNEADNRPHRLLVKEQIKKLQQRNIKRLYEQGESNW